MQPTPVQRDPDPDSVEERPAGVYFVALYFVLAGFFEAIQKFQEWGTVSLNPLSERSIFILAMDPIIYLALAHLIWNFAALGRMAALVVGYVSLGMYLFVAISYFTSSVPLNVTPLFVYVSAFHIVCLIPVISYLQPARQKKRFTVSLWEILLGN